MVFPPPYGSCFFCWVLTDHFGSSRFMDGKGFGFIENSDGSGGREKGPPPRGNSYPPFLGWRKSGVPAFCKVKTSGQNGLKDAKVILGGGFKYFFIFTPKIWGRFPF